MGIYLHEFIVCERVHVNPDNLGAMSALPLLLFKLNTLLKETLYSNHYIQGNEAMV